MDSARSKTVYLVRHGQSVDNVSPVFQSVDSPLSEQGIAQAKTLAERLSAVPFDALIASPTRRAKQTAGYIADKSGKDIVFSDLFVEKIKPDGLDGKPWADKAANRLWHAWEETLFTPGARVGNGENYDDMLARIDKALAFLQARSESTLAVVTHGYFLRALVARVLLGDKLTGPIMQQFQQRTSTENTALTVLKYSDAYEEGFTWRLWTLNDHSHFAE